MEHTLTHSVSLPASEATAPKHPSGWLPVFRVTAGNCLEMYDFMIFGYYAKWIAKAFFPTQSEVSGLLLALATFGSGFLMRPLGAIVLGGYTDRHGRRAGLLLTLALMAVGTLTIACTPGYHSIGIFAPLIVVAGRLVQGLSAGAELGNVSVYLSEIAPAGRKGFYVSWQSASQQISVAAAAAMGLLLAHLMPEATVDQWGWRIPLWIGCAALPLLLWIRSGLEETSEFATKRETPTPKQIARSLGINWRLISVGILFVTLTTTAFYLITAYTPTYGLTTLKLSQKSVLQVTLCVALCNFALLPIMGAVSDRIGRRPLLWTCSALFLATAYPTLHWMVQSPSFSRLLTVELWLAVLYASYNGAMVAYLTELMPRNVRATGFSLAYSTATAIFGGFTPFFCTYFIKLSGDKAAPGLWLSFAAVLALAGALFSARASTLNDRTA